MIQAGNQIACVPGTLPVIEFLRDTIFCPNRKQFFLEIILVCILVHIGMYWYVMYYCMYWFMLFLYAMMCCMYWYALHTLVCFWNGMYQILVQHTGSSRLSNFLHQETILASMACTATYIGVYWIRHVVLTCIQKQSWIHDDLNLEASHDKYSSCGMHWVCIVVCIEYVLKFIGIYENLFAGSLVDEGW